MTANRVADEIAPAAVTPTAIDVLAIVAATVTVIVGVIATVLPLDDDER